MCLHEFPFIQRLLTVFTLFGTAFGANVTVQHCRINQQYDEDRIACLDRCGVTDNTVCDVSEFCSSTVDWAISFNPPICLSHCTKPCVTHEYCEHTSHRCLPCNRLCDQREIDDCRRYCYEVFIARTTSLMPPVGTLTPSFHCTSEQYFDPHRQVCLNRCGINNELKCTVGYICSSSSQSDGQRECVSWCDPPCGAMNYCDNASRQCLSCENICSGSDNDACRIYCYDTYALSLSTTPASEQTSMCQMNQYYDENKAVCRDRCGHDAEIICNVGEFCSSTIVTTSHINPPVCINLCNETCREGYFCDPFSYICRQCSTQCVGSSCHLFCDEYSPHSTTTSNPCAAASEDCPAFSAASKAVIAVVSVIAAIGLPTLVWFAYKYKGNCSQICPRGRCREAPQSDQHDEGTDMGPLRGNQDDEEAPQSDQDDEEAPQSDQDDEEAPQSDQDDEGMQMNELSEVSQ